MCIFGPFRALMNIYELINLNLQFMVNYDCNGHKDVGPLWLSSVGPTSATIMCRRRAARCVLSGNAYELLIAKIDKGYVKYIEIFM